MVIKLIKTIKIGEYDVNFYGDGSIDLEINDYDESTICLTKDDIKRINKELDEIDETT